MCADLRSVESVGERVERTFGRLDILVNNAGIMGPQGPLYQLSPDRWDQVFNTNLRGVFYMVRSLAPLMIRARAGHIINISSLAGKNALANGAAYSASKWGLNGLSYSRRRRATRSQHSRFGGLPWVCAHGVQSA